MMDCIRAVFEISDFIKIYGLRVRVKDSVGSTVGGDKEVKPRAT